MIETWTIYDIVGTGLLLLIAVPTSVIFLCALCCARRRKDPARSWLALYKAAFGFFALTVMLFFFNYLLSVLYSQLNDAAVEQNDTDIAFNILRASVQTGIIGNLFDELSIIFALLTFLSLAVAANLVHQEKPSPVDRILLFVGYGFAGVLGVLNIATFALSQKQYSLTYGGSGSDYYNMTSAAWDALKSTRQVYFALLVLQFVFNLGVLVKAILVAVSTKSEPKVTVATRYLIVCCTLLLLKTTYNVGYWAKYVELNNPQYSNRPQPGPYFDIIEVILNFWPMFIIFVILFALGIKKNRGIWSTEQPFMMVNPGGNGMPTQQTPWGFEYSTVPQPPVQPTWQPQQDQHLAYQQEQQQPAYRNPHELPPQHSALHAPQYRQELSSQDQWRGIPEQQPQHPYEMSVETGSASPPPPSHFETMGLNHQADGTPPQTSPLPYHEKK